MQVVDFLEKPREFPLTMWAKTQDLGILRLDEVCRDGVLRGMLTSPFPGVDIAGQRVRLGKYQDRITRARGMPPGVFF